MRKSRGLWSGERALYAFGIDVSKCSEHETDVFEILSATDFFFKKISFYIWKQEILQPKIEIFFAIKNWYMYCQHHQKQQSFIALNRTNKRVQVTSIHVIFFSKSNSISSVVRSGEAVVFMEIFLNHYEVSLLKYYTCFTQLIIRRKRKLSSDMT